MRPRTLAATVSAAIAFVTLVTAPALGGTPGSPVAAEPLAGLHTGMARMLDSLSASELAAPHTLLHYRGVAVPEAEMLFANCFAAVYLADSGELLAMPLDDSGTVDAGVLGTLTRASATPIQVESLGSVALSDLTAEMRRALPVGGTTTPQVVVKLPMRASRPNRQSTTAVTTWPVPAPAAVILQEGFETDPWATWQRQDNTQGQYTWGLTNCDKHGGTSSVDAIRGGSLAGSLTCSTPYPNNYTVWMWDPRCNSIQGATQAWLDFYLSFATASTGSDGFGVFFPGADNRLYGHGYLGTMTGWWHVVDNLKQWYVAGDLTLLPCLELNLEFDSDASGTEGFGARVDDITIRTDAPHFKRAPSPLRRRAARRRSRWRSQEPRAAPPPPPPSGGSMTVVQPPQPRPPSTPSTPPANITRRSVSETGPSAATPGSPYRSPRVAA